MKNQSIGSYINKTVLKFWSDFAVRKVESLILEQTDILKFHGIQYCCYESKMEGQLDLWKKDKSINEIDNLIK